MKILFVVVSFLGLLQAQVLSTDIAPFLRGNQFEGITLLDQKVLEFKEIDGVKFSEISDLAYDSKEKKLYFVSDEGKLFIFDASFSEKIERLSAVSGLTLLKKKVRSLEGGVMTVKGWR